MKMVLKLLLLSFLFIGCSSRNPEIFLNRSNCSAPCWYGLTPRKTTLADSQTILASLPFVSAESLKADPGYLFWRFTGEASGQGRLYFDSGGNLQKIALEPDGLALGQVIDTFGAPENVWANYLPGDGTTYALTLYYPLKGIVVEVRDKPLAAINSGSESITRELRISELKFFAPTSLENVLKDIEAWSPDNVSYIQSRLQPWPGFGESVIQIKP